MLRGSQWLHVLDFRWTRDANGWPRTARRFAVELSAGRKVECACPARSVLGAREETLGAVLAALPWPIGAIESVVEERCTAYEKYHAPSEKEAE